eukprot:TRINITY_DN42771_c0_g1_i1.p1 TRINITY_DN42771_c0_g1~~TRINITY_DN42771_c0_g1_i1.p1  ORF type:complete len:241 (+),score=37.55 TRINITY_DN42771_c0_g1_i1:68-790(+)
MGADLSTSCCGLGGKDRPPRLIEEGTSIHKVCLHRSLDGKEQAFKEFMNKAVIELKKVPCQGMSLAAFALPKSLEKCWTVMILEGRKSLEDYKHWSRQHIPNMELVAQSPQEFDHSNKVFNALTKGPVAPGNCVRIRVYKFPDTPVMRIAWEKGMFQESVSNAWRKATRDASAGLVHMTMSQALLRVVFTMFYDSVDAMEYGNKAFKWTHLTLERGQFTMEYDEGGDKDDPLVLCGPADA